VTCATREEAFIDFTSDPTAVARLLEPRLVLFHLYRWLKCEVECLSLALGGFFNEGPVDVSTL
jgi:hypothetical protein